MRCLYERSRATLTICHGEALLDEPGTACWWRHAYIRLKRYTNHPCTQCLHNRAGEILLRLLIGTDRILSTPSHFSLDSYINWSFPHSFQCQNGIAWIKKIGCSLFAFVCLQIYFWFIFRLYSEVSFGMMCLPAHCTPSTLLPFFFLVPLFIWFHYSFQRISLSWLGCFD